MTETPPPLSTFSELRRAGISYAQDASGDVWTDYNVHDPGVTFLEQTCFALSHLAYQTAFPTRDLLTTAKTDFPFREYGFLSPRKVLRTGPVTRDDLERWLSGYDNIDGISLRPRSDSHPGLYDMVIYGGDAAAPVLEEQMRTAFDRVRPLGCALGDVAVAQRVDVILHGHVEISAGALPNTIAAEIYNTVRDILSGQTSAQSSPEKGATRATAFEAPERLFESPRRSSVPKLRADNQPRKSRKLEPQTKISLASHLGLIRALPGVHEVEDLSLHLRFPENPVPKSPLYLYAVLPSRPEHLKLTLTVDGAPLVLNAARLREDYVRIRAERVGQSHHHIHAPDWDVLKPGRHRSFDQSHVDSLLPTLYQVGGYYPQDDSTALLAQYRSVIDTVLKSMSGALSNLPKTFQANAKGDLSDPATHRACVVLLDYLLALQGLEMPLVRHTGFHGYRGTVARHRFEIAWRLLALELLPDCQATRATAPGVAGPGGFLASLALLCDLDLAVEPPGWSALAEYQLRLVKDAPLNTQPGQQYVSRADIENLLDLLPIEDPDAKPYPPAEFATFLPFVSEGLLCPKHFHRLAEADAVFVAPGSSDEDTWQVLVNFKDGTAPWAVAFFGENSGSGNDPRRAAYLCAARLRATWRALHRRSETLRLIEPDVTRAGPPAPFTALLCVSGWTARTSQPSFRQYVETQVARLAPAHIHVQVIWQNYTASDVSQQGDNEDRPDTVSLLEATV